MAKTRIHLLATVGGLFAIATATLAQDAPAVDEDALAKTWERAQTQIGTCKSLEEKTRYELAARCYDDVANMLTAAAGARIAPAVTDTRPTGSLVASPQIPRPAPPASVVARRQPARVASRTRPARRVLPESGPLPGWTAQVSDASGQRCRTLVCSRFVLIGVGF
jgi:hypothetical protein